MANTRLQLANRALAKLMEDGGSGQSPAAEDTQRVDEIIPRFAAYLSEANIYEIADLEDIQDSAFEWLAQYLAYFVADDFGKPQDEAKRIGAENMLVRITATRPTREPLQAEYF